MITVHDRLLLLTLFSKKLHQGRRSRTWFPGNFSAFNSLSVGIVLYSSLSSHFLIFYSLSINYKKINSFTRIYCTFILYDERTIETRGRCVWPDIIVTDCHHGLSNVLL